MTTTDPITVLSGIQDDAPIIPIEALAAVHTLDLDTLVPAARNWRAASRAHVGRLLRQIAPVLRALVAEIVILDRRLSDAEDELATLRTEAAKLRTQATADPTDAAWRVAQRLAAELVPAPESVTVERYLSNEPSVALYAHADRDAISAWAQALSVTLDRAPSGPGYERLSGECTVDGVVVRLSGLAKVAVAVAS